jgi:hypothetical protein
VIRNSTLKNNGYGIYTEPDCNNNLIYNNNFLSNTNHAYNGNQQNIWNQQYPICGNYWDDYQEQWIDKYPDLDLNKGPNQNNSGKDCIGDYEYRIQTFIYDWLPLMNRYGWRSPKTAPLLTGQLKELNTTGFYILSWSKINNTANYSLEEGTDEYFLNPIKVFIEEKSYYKFENKPDGTYYYRVRAQNLFGISSWSNVVKVIVDRLPNVPSGLNVKQIITGNELKIRWNVNNYDTFNYTIWSNKTGIWTPIINITHPGTEFIDSNLTDGIRYYYKLQSWDARGLSSGFTSIVSNISIDKVAPSTPTNFKITTITTDRINMSPELDLVGYDIYRGSNSDGTFKKINTNLINATNYNDTGLNSNTTYFYELIAYDEVPNYSNFTEIIYETTLPILDLTKPYILSYTPNGTDVFPYLTIRVTFSEFMNKDSVNRSFNIVPKVQGEYSWSIDDRTFIFEPAEKLAERQTYNVTITIDAKDLAGNHIEKNISWNFTIGDYTAPKVIHYAPNGTNVSINIVIQVVFNEELDVEYITSSAILLKDQNGSFVNGNISYDNLTLTFTLAKDLEYDLTYTVLVNKLLKDEVGNELGIEHTWKFTTIEEPTKSKKGDETEPVDTTTIGIGIIILIILILVTYLILRQSGYLKPKPPPKSVSTERSKLFDEELEE